MSSLSFVFTTWFLNKYISNSDVDSIIANLNDQTWADFLASDIALKNNTNFISQLMPQLVEKKPRKTPVSKKTASKTTVASQTYFDNVEQTVKEDDSVYGMTNDLHTIRQKVQPLTPDYNTILGKQVCDWIDNNFAWYQQGFGYTK